MHATAAHARALPGVVHESRAQREAVREFASGALERVRQAHRGDVERCTAQAAGQNPQSAGTLTLRVVVNPQGAVLDAVVRGSSVPVYSFGPCVASAVRRWVFPAPASRATVTVDLVFTIEPPAEPPPRRFVHGER